jgi:peroxiredoxin
MGLEPGDEALTFNLTNANSEVGGEEVSLSDIVSESGAIVVFECNHCPYVIGNIERMEKMASRAREYGLGFVGINANDAVKYPDDSFENMQKRGTGMSYAYLHDESQEVAEQWGAERTPEFYLLNSKSKIVYRGRLDNSPNDPTKATTRELMEAMDTMLMGDKPIVERTRSIGCSIKWK